MFRLFRRKERMEPADPEARQAEIDMYDRAAENLIAQGVDPKKVRRATAMVKRFADAGVLPEGLVKPAEEE